MVEEQWNHAIGDGAHVFPVVQVLLVVLMCFPGQGTGLGSSEVTHVTLFHIQTEASCWASKGKIDGAQSTQPFLNLPASHSEELELGMSRRVAKYQQAVNMW